MDVVLVICDEVAGSEELLSGLDVPLLLVSVVSVVVFSRLM